MSTPDQEPGSLPAGASVPLPGEAPDQQAPGPLPEQAPAQASRSLPGRGAGSLVIVATPIGNLGDLSPRARQALAGAEVVACEDTRHTGRLLAASGTQAKRLVSLHAHNEAARTAELSGLLEAGRTVALVSDAGTPLVSDPGARLVAAALGLGATVTTVPGPSAGLAALVVSGLDTTRWRFEGFLPRKGPERRAAIGRVAAALEPSICYESPRRLAATLAELAAVCGTQRKVAVARELTKLHEEVLRTTLGEAARRAGEGEARGEHVIVVDGVAPTSRTGSADGTGRLRRPRPDGLAGAWASGELDDEQLAELLGRLVSAGLSRRDAATAAEVLLGVSHRSAYRAALATGAAGGTGAAGDTGAAGAVGGTGEAGAEGDPGSGDPPEAPVR